MKKILFIFLVLFLISFVSATNQSYQIFDKGVLVELEFEEVENLVLEIPKDAKALEVNTNYIFEKGILKVDSGEEVVIKYITDYFVEKTSKGYFFVIENQLENSEVFVYLPEGSKISEKGIVFPSNFELSSDGHRIILNWENLEEETIFVSYEFSKENDFFVYLVFGLILICLICFYVFERKKYIRHLKKVKKLQKAEKEKVKEVEEKVFTANLFGDEKKIIEFLKNKKEGSWTKEISKELEINKVTLSRKLRNLEQKGLIKKIHYGNADKIFLKK